MTVQVRWVCVVDRDHPTVGDSISSEQYFALPHVFGRPSGYTATAEELVRRLLDIDLPVHITVPSLLHLPLVLRGTRLVATMPERVAQMFATTLPIKAFALPFQTPALNEKYYSCSGGIFATSGVSARRECQWCVG